MILWRISNYSNLDGRGGLFSSARWLSAGNPIVYFAESPSGALAEVLVHLELSEDNIPADYQLLKAEAPDNIPIPQVEEITLPVKWRADSIVTRTIGDEWIAAGATALLRVPSAIVPETFNILLNPQHSDAAKVKVLWHRNYPWDRRLFE